MFGVGFFIPTNLDCSIVNFDRQFKKFLKGIAILSLNLKKNTPVIIFCEVMGVLRLPFWPIWDD